MKNHHRSCSSWSYNSLNQLVSSSDGVSYNYDMNGNLIRKTEPQGTTTYQWNGFDKLRKVILPDNSEISFIYGADGLRRKNITSSGATNHLLDGLSVLAEYDDSGNMSVSYVPGVSITKDGATYYYHYDGLGSVRFLSDSTGAIVQEYNYDAWGNLTNSLGSLSQPYQYVGEQYYYTEPLLNLQLLGQRWYNPDIGRFISRDPIGEDGGLNLYGYVRNNAVNLIDFKGLSSKGVKEIIHLNITDDTTTDCFYYSKFDFPIECAERIRNQVAKLPGDLRDPEGRILHCIASCRISRECLGGKFTAWIAGDWVQDPWWRKPEDNSDPVDRKANKIGRDLSKELSKSCELLCKEAFDKGLIPRERYYEQK